MANSESECIALKRLEEGIKNQCINYLMFHPDYMFGSMPGMYEPNHLGEIVPTDLTSGYFRGGIINTIATFDAFVYDLLQEACDEVAKQKYPDEDMRRKQTDLDESWKKYSKKQTKIEYHDWTKMYSKILLNTLVEDMFADVIFKQGPITLLYPIDGNKSSRIEVSNGLSNRRVICSLFNLYYNGIRCIMAHGVLETTETHEYKPCTNCKKYDKFHESCELVEYYHEYIGTLSSDEVTGVEKQVRRIPRLEIFQNFNHNFKNKQKALDIIAKHFTEPTATPLPASYAYFHMCRVRHWLKEDKRNMYITYRMLVRVNQFIHMMAYRMYLAVTQVLIEDFELPNEFWGIKKEEIGDKISEFEKNHKEIVEKIQEMSPFYSSHNFTMSTIHKFAADKVLRTTMTNNIWNVSVGTITCEQEIVEVYLAVKKRKNTDTTSENTDATRSENTDTTRCEKPVTKIKESIKIN